MLRSTPINSLRANAYLAMLNASLPACLALATLIAVAMHGYSLFALHNSEAAAPSIEAKVHSPSKTLTHLSALHMMGDSDKTAVVANSKVVPLTRLKLNLLGVFTSTEDGKGSALVAGKDKTAKRYYVGENVPSGATLNAVYSDYVLLNRSGALEQLRFPKADRGSSASLNVASVKPSSRQSSQNSTVSSAGRNTNTKKAESIRDRLRTLRMDNNGS